jgi:hypothetical protein
VTDASLVDVDLIVVATFEALVAEEMDLIVESFDELEAKALIPSLREHIERDLAAN